MTDKTPRWTEIEHLPAWDEEFYEVYTARKYGKWVMMKTLRPEFRNDPKYVEMLNREFDVRYNLSHPNIVMINDFEEVPGVGLSIITDDVYGPSLSKLLEEGKLTDFQYRQLTTRLPMALEYIQQNRLAHRPLSVDNVIFTENIGNLKLIDVGYDQKKALSHAVTYSDVEDWGRLMQQVHAATMFGDSRLRHIADRAASGGFRNVIALEQALSGSKRSYIRLIIIAAIILLALAVVLGWMQSHYHAANVTI